MTDDTDWLTSGLVFVGFKDIDIVNVSNQVLKGLQSLDVPTLRTHILSDICAIITTEHYVIRTTICEDVEIATLLDTVEVFLAVQITENSEACSARQEGKPKKEKDVVLAHILTILHGLLSPDYVKWIERNAVISSADFVKAVHSSSSSETKHDEPELTLTSVTKDADNYSVIKLSRANKLPEIELTADALQNRLQAHGAMQDNSSLNSDLRSIFQENYTMSSATQRSLSSNIAKTLSDDRPLLRLSTWFISIAITLFSLPVGAALLVYNFLKGENLRLTSQTTALTGTFIGLNTSGVTAQAIETIQVIIK